MLLDDHAPPRGFEGTAPHLSEDHPEPEPPDLHTNWNAFWTVPCVMVVISLVAFVLSGGK